MKKYTLNQFFNIDEILNALFFFYNNGDITTELNSLTLFGLTQACFKCYQCIYQYIILLLCNKKV